tara:strand:+ start:1379 stop:3415 length:2037 start_codon:yes stop_codon:yes gene_type:complete
MISYSKNMLGINGSKKQIQLILIGVALKFFLGIYFFTESEVIQNYLTLANNLVASNLNNPYSNDFQDAQAFPYPSIFLYLLVFVFYTANILGINEFIFFILLLTIFFIIFDLITLRVMSAWVGEKNRTQLIVLYWFSPVLIYLSYFSGSFDVLVLCLFFLGLDYLFKRKFFESSVLMGLAMSTKTFVILVMPFIVLYLFSNRYGLGKIIIYLTTLLFTFIFINIQFISSDGFFETIFINSGQTRVFDSFIPIGDSKFYLIPGILLLIIFKGFLIKNFNKDLFIIYLAFAFGLFLIFIEPEKYWYYWLLPHLLYFYSKFRGKSVYLLYVLQLAFFLYFLTDEGFILNEIVFADLLNMFSYTFLQFILLCNIFWVYFNGVQVLQNKKLYSQPFILGIGGNSGTGKTTLSNSFEKIFSKNFSCSIKGDDLHRWKRGDSNWNEYTHLNPKANLIHDEIHTLKTLKISKEVKRDIYNHNTGNFDKDVLITPKNLVIYEGLHPFFLENQRVEYDLKLMVMPEEDLNHHWKIIRDKSKRNKTKNEVLEQINKRESDYKKYILPQVEFADVVIKPYISKKIKDLGNSNEMLDICYELTINIPISLDSYYAILSKFKGIKLDYKYTENGSQNINISGEITPEQIEELNTFNKRFLDDLGVVKPDFPNGIYGLVVSILIYIVISKELD